MMSHQILVSGFLVRRRGPLTEIKRYLRMALKLLPILVTRPHLLTRRNSDSPVNQVEFLRLVGTLGTV